MYWSDVFSNLEVAPFGLSKGSSNGGCLRTVVPVGNPLQKARYIYKFPCFDGRGEGVVMATSRCTSLLRGKTATKVTEKSHPAHGSCRNQSCGSVPQQPCLGASC